MTPIFVAGLPRTGTSLVAGAIVRCGFWVGHQPKPSQYNARGFFEDCAVMRRVNDRLLWRYPEWGNSGSAALPADFRSVELRRDVLRYTHLSGRDSDRWLLKDPRLTFLWPFYKAAFPEAVWVVTRRDRDSFVASCLNTPFMRAVSDDPRHWIDVYRRGNARLDHLVSVGGVEVLPERLLSHDYTALCAAVAAAGGECDVPAIEAFVDPELWHFTAADK